MLMREAKSWQAKQVILPHQYMQIKPWLTGINCQINIFDSPCARVFFPEKTQEKKVICEILMQEDQSWQAKGMILPNQYIQIKPWLTGMNCPYLCFWFTLCKGLFSWGKTGKKGNLWNFDARSQILKSKTHNPTTPLYENQTLDHKDQFSISLIFFHHVQGSFFLRKGRKKRWFVTYSCVKPNLDPKTCDTTTPIYDNQTFSHRHQLYISMFLIHHVQGSFFLRKCGINREFVKFWCVKPNLDRQKAWYYHTTRFKLILGSKSSIVHI